MTLKYFNLKEFRCKCGCKTNLIDPDFVLSLDKARGYAKTPFKINSGYRCVNHPLSKQRPTSSHIKGLAADIHCKDNKIRAKIISGLAEAFFNRLGISKDFIHADLDKCKKQPVIWLY